MTGSPKVTRSTPVSACEGLLAFEPLSVARDADVIDVLRLAARQPTTRLIAVVDADRRLVGVLRIGDLVEAVVARTMPEALMTDAVDVESVVHFGQVVESHTAADVMEEPAAVAPDATIARAFREMSRRKLSGVYVVDGEGRPIGYLDKLELAYLVVTPPPAER